MIMECYMLVFGLIIFKMEKVKKPGQMEIFIKETFIKVKNMGKADSLGMIVPGM